MSVRRNSSLTITFEAIDLYARPARKGGLTIANTSCWVSKDGGNFANTTNAATELTGVTGRYKLVLTATEMDAAWVHVVVEKAGLMDPYDIKIGTHGSPSAVVQSYGSNSTTVIKVNRTETAADHFKNCLVLFTAGVLKDQIQKVISSVSADGGTTTILTVMTPFTSIPSAADRLVLVNE